MSEKRERYVKYLLDIGENEIYGFKQDKSKLLQALYESVKDCQACALGKSRTKLVFGAGNTDARLMFIGEAPGRNEDLTGIPFVGRAGKLLDKILNAMRLSRDEIYIANILKCRPPNNRDPLPEEEEVCISTLMKQMDIIQPEIICCLGRIAAQVLLGNKMTMKQLRTLDHKFRGIPLVPTYHPAALLRNENLKKPTWDDMLKICDYLGIKVNRK